MMMHKNPKNLLSKRLFLLAAAFGFALGIIAAPAISQEAVGDQPQGTIYFLPVKAVKAEIITLPEPILLYFSGKIQEVEEGLMLTINVFTRDVDRFPPSLHPMLFIGNRSYPIFKTEYSNWDIVKEQPIDESLPVGETQLLYVLVPDWQSLEPRARLSLAVEGPETTRQQDVSEELLRNFNLLPGSSLFDAEMIKDPGEDG